MNNMSEQNSIEINKKKTIVDQRSDKDLIFRCNCGGGHFVSFSWIKDEPEFGFYVEIIDFSTDIWTRIKNAFVYIFKGGKNYWADIGLTDKDLKKLQEHINEYLKSLDEVSKNKNIENK